MSGTIGAFLFLTMIFLGGCVTANNGSVQSSTPQNPTVINPVRGSPDPNFVGAATNRQVDQDEEELRLVP